MDGSVALGLGLWNFVGNTMVYHVKNDGSDHDHENIDVHLLRFTYV